VIISHPEAKHVNNYFWLRICDSACNIDPPLAVIGIQN
jgi:hypothetical protein